MATTPEIQVCVFLSFPQVDPHSSPKFPVCLPLPDTTKTLRLLSILSLVYFDSLL